MAGSNIKSPFEIKNVRLFIAFKIFFNSRFYYPVFTILFLDFGLSVAQFALLNAIWAATIVMAEVPSGALADVLGRKKLIVATGIIMFMEIAILCFAPVAGAFKWVTPNSLFIIFIFNRVLSGLAEASASGADEALAYDALVREGLEEGWGRVLDLQMRVQSMGYIIAMIIGAAVYDPSLVGKIVSFMGLDLNITQSLTLRFPLFLTLGMAVITLIIALGMDDICIEDKENGVYCKDASVKDAFKLTFKAGAWILATPFALLVISAGLIFDGIIRMVITLSSQFFRLIEIPEAFFGIIGALIALMGIIVPRISLYLSKRCSPRVILLIMGITTFTGLFGMKFFSPYYGLVPAFILFGTMYMTGFFVSHYLNKIADSGKRATILSFKGLAFNLSYGLLGILYSILLANIRGGVGRLNPELSGIELENIVFIEAFAWFPWVFVSAILVFLLFAFARSFRKQIP